MAIILDTDVTIKGEKGDLDVVGWLATQTGQELEIAAITVAELWHESKGPAVPIGSSARFI